MIIVCHNCRLCKVEAGALAASQAPALLWRGRINEWASGGVFHRVVPPPPDRPLAKLPGVAAFAANSQQQRLLGGPGNGSRLRHTALILYHIDFLFPTHWVTHGNDERSSPAELHHQWVRDLCVKGKLYWLGSRDVESEAGLGLASSRIPSTAGSLASRPERVDHLEKTQMVTKSKELNSRISKYRQSCSPSLPGQSCEALHLVTFGHPFPLP